jgi:Dual specificity phosphatase, catalytic domain
MADDDGTTIPARCLSAVGVYALLSQEYEAWPLVVETKTSSYSQKSGQSTIDGGLVLPSGGSSTLPSARVIMLETESSTLQCSCPFRKDSPEAVLKACGGVGDMSDLACARAQRGVNMIREGRVDLCRWICEEEHGVDRKNGIAGDQQKLWERGAVPAVVYFCPRESAELLRSRTSFYRCALGNILAARASQAGGRVWPPNEVVMDEVYISDGVIARQPAAVAALGIGAVVNVTEEDHSALFEEFAPGVRYFHVCVADRASTQWDMAPILAFMRRNVEEGRRVLVHCEEGKSRSATVVLAFLLEEKQWPLLFALIALFAARTVCSPLNPFVAFLIDRERVLRGETSLCEEDFADTYGFGCIPALAQAARAGVDRFCLL